MRVFLDTNILLDVVEARPGLVEDSSAVLVLCDEIQADLFIAWHSLATLYYLIRRRRSEAATIYEIDRILVWANIAPVDSDSATRARSLSFSDFEDAMQCVCAENCLADIIVTRNVKDFAASPIRVFSPADFLLQYGVT